MAYSMEEKTRFIIKECLRSVSKNPIAIAKAIMHQDFVSLHGPEHHLLDGAAFLTAYKNAGGNIDLENCLDQLAARAKTMPGGMCGFWGVCGSAASLGAALSIIHGTGPLSAGDAYKDQMEFTSLALSKIGAIGGPRCCKRNAFISLSVGIDFVKRKYGIEMEGGRTICEFSPLNSECLGDRCPFHQPK
jgi:hypothetical protein